MAVSVVFCNVEVNSCDLNNVIVTLCSVSLAIRQSPHPTLETYEIQGLAYIKIKLLSDKLKVGGLVLLFRVIRK